MADEEDIALSVFDTLVRGAANGKFPLLHDRYDLWHLLVALTRQKVVDLRRFETRQKRGQGLVKNVASLGYNFERARMMTLDDLVGDAPTPEYISILSDEFRRAMQILNDDVLIKIAKDKLEGYTTSEIAKRLDISQRTVQRKLILIQNRWIQQLANTSELPRRTLND